MPSQHLKFKDGILLQKDECLNVLEYLLWSLVMKVSHILEQFWCQCLYIFW